MMESRRWLLPTSSSDPLSLITQNSWDVGTADNIEFMIIRNKNDHIDNILLRLLIDRGNVFPKFDTKNPRIRYRSIINLSSRYELRVLPVPINVFLEIGRLGSQILNFLGLVLLTTIDLFFNFSSQVEDKIVFFPYQTCLLYTSRCV